MSDIKKYISILVMCSVWSSGLAQLTNNGQVISITGAIPVIVKGAVATTGTFANDGELTVEGDWLNSGGYTSNTGRLMLTSDIAQSMTHNGDVFYNLDLLGIGVKTLTDSAKITNVLTLTTSLLNINTNGNLLIQSTGDIVGATSLSYINGLLYHEGIGLKNFPIGTQSNYLPVILEDVLGVNPILGIQVIEPNLNPVAGSGLESVSGIRYWELIRKSGVFDGSIITLSIGTDENTATGIENIVVAESNILGGPFINIGQSNISLDPANSFVTSTQLILGSYFTIALSGEGSVDDIFVPNAFSLLSTNPDDQVIKVYGSFISPDDFSFSVYNKWGGVIFETTDLDLMATTGWTGINVNTGEQVAFGVFTYTIQGKLISGRAFDKIGTITVIQ